MNWIKSSEKLPKKAGPYIISYDGHNWQCAYWENGKFYDLSVQPKQTFNTPKWWAKIKGPLSLDKDQLRNLIYKS